MCEREGEGWINEGAGKPPWCCEFTCGKLPAFATSALLICILSLFSALVLPPPASISHLSLLPRFCPSVLLYLQHSAAMKHRWQFPVFLNSSQFCISIKYKKDLKHFGLGTKNEGSIVPRRTCDIHVNFPFNKGSLKLKKVLWVFKMFFTLRKNGSFKN